MIKHLSSFLNSKLASAIGLVFIAVGFLFGTWANLIPFIKDKFGLDEAQLGMLLLFMPLGAGLMNLLSVQLINRLGTVKATLVSLVALSLLIIMPAISPTIWLVGVALFFFGMGYSAINISMNTCASQLEIHSGTNLIATCHGLWSGGAMLGSASAGIAYSWGAAPPVYVCLFAGLAILVGLFVKRPLSKLPEDHFGGEIKEKSNKAFLKPNPALWVLIVIGLCVNLGEGGMSDWSVVYMKEVLGTTESVASWGFAVFAFFMMSGRLLGDGLLTQFGSKKVLRSCGILMTIGLFTAVFAPIVWVLFIGYAMIGAGVSLGSPILYAAAAKVPGLPKGAGLAIYNTYAMVGFLGGPVLIGFIANEFSLPVAFGMVAIAAIVWVISVRRME